MALVNYYSIAHLLIWFFGGRYTQISWITFLILSLGWEGLELILPFEFAVESILNKFGDIVINIIGFSMGLRFQQKSKQGNP